LSVPTSFSRRSPPILPRVYARNQISRDAFQAVDESEYDLYKKFCRTLEVVLQRIFRSRGELKSRMKIASRAAMTCEIGWMKLLYQRDLAN